MSIHMDTRKCQQCGYVSDPLEAHTCKPVIGTTPTARPETTQVSETPGDGRNEAVAPPEGGRAVALATLEVYYCGDGKGGKAIPTREALNLPAGHYSLYASPPSPSGAAGLLADALRVFRGIADANMKAWGYTSRAEFIEDFRPWAQNMARDFLAKLDAHLKETGNG